MVSNNIKRIFAFLMAVVFMIVPVLSVGANSATRERLRVLEQEVDEARALVSEARNLLEGTEFEMNAILLEIQELDQRFMDVAAALGNVEMSLLETELNIYYAEADLAAANEERELQYAVFRTRLRVMHEQGPVGFLEVLFQAESIADFFMRMEYVRAVAQFDQEMLARLEEAENNVASHVDTLARNRSLLLDLNRQHREAEAQVQLALNEREAWFNALAEDAEYAKMLMLMLEEEQRLIEEEFGATQARLHRELAEQERIRHQEEARRQEEQRQAQLAHLNNFGGQFAWPVPTHAHISSGFGPRSSPITGQDEFHTGIDIPAPTGTRIIAAADGYVRFVGRSGGFGNMVIIDHGNGYSTLYAHNSINRVSQGQRVNRGDHIADVGSTGASTGPHLHFEIRVNNAARNPSPYFNR